MGTFWKMGQNSDPVGGIVLDCRAEERRRRKSEEEGEKEKAGKPRTCRGLSVVSSQGPRKATVLLEDSGTELVEDGRGARDHRYRMSSGAKAGQSRKSEMSLHNFWRKGAVASGSVEVSAERAVAMGQSVLIERCDGETEKRRDEAVSASAVWRKRCPPNSPCLLLSLYLADLRMPAPPSPTSPSSSHTSPRPDDRSQA